MSSKDVIFLPNILDIEMEKSQTEYKGVCLLCVCVFVCVCLRGRVYGYQFWPMSLFPERKLQ
jgi:hypothetical protein